MNELETNMNELIRKTNINELENKKHERRKRNMNE